jgi:hypothetical protein
VRRWHADLFGFLWLWNELRAFIVSVPPSTPLSTELNGRTSADELDFRRRARRRGTARIGRMFTLAAACILIRLPKLLPAAMTGLCPQDHRCLAWQRPTRSAVPHPHARNSARPASAPC